MRLMSIALVAALMAGGLASAQDKDKKKDKCPLAGIMCPAEGCCEGVCREFCNKGGEALTALRAKVAAALKEKKDALAAHQVGVCKAKECKECAWVESTGIVPIFKTKVSARFGEMNKEVNHEIAGKDGKTTTVACTLLTGKLCDACVDQMKKDALAKIEEAKKDRK